MLLCYALLLSSVLSIVSHGLENTRLITKRHKANNKSPQSELNMPHRHSPQKRHERRLRAIEKGYLRNYSSWASRKTWIPTTRAVAKRAHDVSNALAAHRLLDIRNDHHQHSASAALQVASSNLPQETTKELKEIIIKGNRARHAPWSHCTVASEVTNPYRK